MRHPAGPEFGPARSGFSVSAGDPREGTRGRPAPQCLGRPAEPRAGPRCGRKACAARSGRTASGASPAEGWMARGRSRRLVPRNGRVETPRPEMDDRRSTHGRQDSQGVTRGSATRDLRPDGDRLRRRTEQRPCGTRGTRARPGSNALMRSGPPIAVRVPVNDGSKGGRRPERCLGRHVDRRDPHTIVSITHVVRANRTENGRTATRVRNG